VVLGVAATVLATAVARRTRVLRSVRDVPRAHVVRDALDRLSHRRDEAVHEDDEEQDAHGVAIVASEQPDRQARPGCYSFATRGSS
jgi:hypothetical protein